MKNELTVDLLELALQLIGQGKMNERLPTLKPIYGWSNVAKFEVGPRREITLFMRLWRSDVLNRHEHNWEQNRESVIIAPVRFGGVENLEEVRTFFERVTAKTSRLNQGGGIIEKFGYACEHQSRPNEIYFRVYDDVLGDEIIIKCQNVTEQENFSENE